MTLSVAGLAVVEPAGTVALATDREGLAVVGLRLSRWRSKAVCSALPQTSKRRGYSEASNALYSALIKNFNILVLFRYLLQVAQALKHECHLHCPLVELLLERALNNQHIGHHLFWELRAEMNSPSSGLLFGLLLEAYLAAAPEHFNILEHQYALLDKCKATHETLAALDARGGSANYDKARVRFEVSTRTQMGSGGRSHHHPFVDFVSPLTPWIRCGRVKLEQCRLMNSKMRPQMLAFENGDARALADEAPQSTGHLDDVVIMYKKGDDLRQDRLTLQLLKASCINII